MNEAFAIFEAARVTVDGNPVITVDPAAAKNKISPYLRGFNLSYYKDTDQLWGMDRLHNI